MLQELAEELRSDLGFILRKYHAEETEDPVGGVHLRCHVMLFEVLVQFWEVLFNQHLDNVTVFFEAR